MDILPNGGTVRDTYFQITQHHIPFPIKERVEDLNFEGLSLKVNKNTKIHCITDLEII